MSFDELSEWSVYDPVGHRKYVIAAERASFLVAADEREPKVRALCYVYALTGCRVSEALQLAHHLVDPETGRLRFKTLKRRKLVWRSVPVPFALIDMLLDLPTHDDGRYWPIHRTTAYRWVKTVMSAAQIKPGPHQCPRGFRHGLGMAGAAGAMPLPLIQRVLGHARPSTTACYLDAAGLEEREFMKRTWPAGFCDERG